jgi:hypothetical protein
MRIITAAYSVGKAGSARNENDDACWPPQGGEHRAFQYRAAVADGATESTFAGVWAKQLVRAFYEKQLDVPQRSRRLPRMLAPLQDEWARHVAGRQLPWYAEEKARTGAFSTFLGVRFWTTQRRSAAPGQWEAWAVGDSCLAHVRGDQLKCCFPITRAADFNSRPTLLSSNATRNEGVNEHIAAGRGIWRSDDLFLLMTDALAAWFLAEVERGGRPWEPLRNLDTEGEPRSFPELVDALRDHGGMRNDDTTLLRIDII